MRRILITLALIGVAGFVFEPVLRAIATRVWFVYSLSSESAPDHLDVPIQTTRGRRIVDSWAAPRPGGRRHEGVDLFAAKGTPVVSTTRGIVTRVGTNRLGGQIVGVLGPGLEWHYYAHLDRFGAFHEGDLVQAGDVLGYVGTTGNARGTPPHLHYGIYHAGSAANPYPRFVDGGTTARAHPKRTTASHM